MTLKCCGKSFNHYMGFLRSEFHGPIPNSVIFLTSCKQEALKWTLVFLFAKMKMDVLMLTCVSS